MGHYADKFTRKVSEEQKFFLTTGDFSNFACKLHFDFPSRVRAQYTVATILFSQVPRVAEPRVKPSVNESTVFTEGPVCLWRKRAWSSLVAAPKEPSPVRQRTQRPCPRAQPPVEATNLTLPSLLLNCKSANIFA